MIETHVHFNSKALKSDLPGLIQRGVAAGVTDFVVVGFDLASSELAVRQAEKNERVWAVVGVHPHDAKTWDKKTAERLRELTVHPRVVAYGEIGLDFYRDLSPREDQYRAFREQLALAREAKLPVVIHSRDAYDEVLEILVGEAPDLTYDVHCFGGERTHAEAIWERGWFLGVDGPVTYKKNDALREIVAAAPQTCLLIETDAPYLTPEPHRGTFPNEPQYLPHVVAKIAEVRREAPAQVATYTTENACRLFPKLQRNLS